MAAKLRVTLVKSPISHTSRTRGTVRALGLHRLGETVELPDTPHIRGMTRAVRFLLQTEELDTEAAAAPSEAAGEGGNAANGDADAPAPAPRRRTKKKEESES
ncbi:hypothetical protein BH23CHL6_BH23CHL6_02730 [soil metagenome]